MADVTEVADTLVRLIADAIYPQGIAAPSLMGDAVRIFQGWPIASELTESIKRNIAVVSVYPKPGQRNTTRFAPIWQTVHIESATLKTDVKGNKVTLSGEVSPNLAITVLVNHQPFTYAVQVGDTLNTVASVLAKRISVLTPATVDNNIICVPSAYHLETRISTPGTRVREFKRQQVTFQISVWANHYAQRDRVAKVVDTALAPHARLALPDGTVGMMQYHDAIQDDSLQKQEIYRRELVYRVEFGAIEKRSDRIATVTRFN